MTYSTAKTFELPAVLKPRESRETTQKEPERDSTQQHLQSDSIPSSQTLTLPQSRPWLHSASLPHLPHAPSPALCGTLCCGLLQEGKSISKANHKFKMHEDLFLCHCCQFSVLLVFSPIYQGNNPCSCFRKCTQILQVLVVWL